MKEYLQFDKRALALMRMAVAAVVMLDLGIRMSDLEAFYANSGVFPLPLMFERGWNDYFVSIHAISGMWQVQLVIFLFSLFCAMMLFIGYRTKLFSILSWFLMLSLHNRNGFILQGGDDLLRMILFWGMFLPWGERWSCDSLLNEKKPEHSTLISAATIAYLLQICYIYTGSALLKGPEWNSDFTAVYYAYSLDQLTYPLAKALYHHPDLLRTMTCIAYYSELCIPILFFIPVKHAWFRTTGVAAIFLFHSFNAITLFIGLFPLIGMATSLGLLPPAFMDWLERKLTKLKEKVAASFSGYAQFVHHFLIRWRRPSYMLRPFWYYVQTAILIFLIVFIFDWNFSNLSFVNSKLSERLRFIGYGLRLDQNWGMFAPGVFKDDGWFVLEGTTAKGEHFNLLSPDQPLDYGKPDNIRAMFKNDRWRKYSENYILAYNDFLRGYYCNYYKRIWNEKHPERQIVSLKVIYMEELTLPDYRYSPPQMAVLWECVDQ